VLDGGETDVGIESTIVDLSGAAPTLVRPGWIGPAELQRALGMPLAAPVADAPRAPGTLAKHYAPQTTLIVTQFDLLMELAATFTRLGKRVAALAMTDRRPVHEGLTWITAPSEPAAYAHTLYANLRELDEAGCEMILVERPPQTAEWMAINDRLTRAAAGSAAQDDT